MSLVEGGQGDGPWERLVAVAPDATAFHHPAWSRVLADTYGYPLVVLTQPDLETGTALARVPRIGGGVWVSLPFSDHCPPLARDAGGLERLAADLAEWGARQGTAVEVRGCLPLVPGWNDVPIGVRHVLPLNRDEQTLRKGISSTHRRRLKEGERSGLGIRFGRSADDLAEFYRLHVATRRRQGVPVQPRRFFDAIRRHLFDPGLGGVVLVARPGDRPVAASVLFAWNGTAIGKYQASDDRAWHLRPNHVLYWAAIRWARDTGCERLDFGRTETRHAGLRQWKTGWGADEVPLSYARTGAAAGPVAGDHGLLGAALEHVIRRSPAVVCRGLGELLYRYAA